MGTARTQKAKSGELVPSVPAASEMSESEMDQIAEHLVASAVTRGVQLTGKGGLLPSLTRRALQTALEAEMSHHLGYKHHPVGRDVANSRNGSSVKTVKTEVGPVTVEVPRDRAGTFEPEIVRKHQRRLAGFDEAVISLYG